MNRRLPPFVCTIDHLGPRGLGVGTAPDGRPIEIRAAPPGARVEVLPQGRRKGVWSGRRLALVEPAPPPDGATPACPLFGLCGGCALQELSLDAQRRHKHALALAEISRDHGPLDGIRVHPWRGAPDAYGYRNRVELSFGPRRYLDEASHAAGLPIDGAFLGFHAPGRFDRVVDAERCALVSDATNTLIGIVRSITLAPGAPPPYDPLTHEGFWRHLLLREAGDERLVVVFTAAADPERAAWAERLLDALAPHAVAVEWRVNPGVADVARGELVASRGRSFVEERLGAVTFRLSSRSFFQTSTAGAQILYDTVGDALGAGGTLLDLYCGIGSIGLYLADRFDRVIGVEENPAAIDDARENARRNGVEAEFFAARVEDALDRVAGGPDVHLVVDPPRAGLHPKVADKLAGLDVASLVYVACHPASLGRDAVILRGGGWRITDLWTVDLFPQTGHVEVVARFTR